MAQRALGIDISAWQGNLSTTNWNTLHNTNDRDFVFIRSSRGGTTGYYNQSDPDNSDGLNTFSQRYDDPYFVQNITRASNAGLFAGPYHFGRADIVTYVMDGQTITHTGTDEADHMMQMSGAWMRPGYLLPVFDLEAGNSQRSTTSLSNFAVDFSNRIYEVMGIRPMVYVNSSYANDEVNSSVATAMPNLWIARWPNQGNPDSIDVQNIDPPAASGYPNVYGVWNPSYPNTPTPHPWKFWQYASTARLSGYANGTANIDVDVANGGIEFLKDTLVPALWMNDSSGDWSLLANWNSGQTPVAPVQGPGQVARVGPLTLPAVRLPGANDTVILDRPNASIDVTISSGSHNIRKLDVRETLDITGGSLTVNYDPTVAGATKLIAAQFSAPVSLGDGASFSVHTLLVDAGQTFTLGGGTLAINTIQLVPNSSTPAKILALGDVQFIPLADASATITHGPGSGITGKIDLGGGTRAFDVADGAANEDLSVDVPVTNGSLIKTGLGTLALNGANSYAGDTQIEAGTLSISTRYLADVSNVYLSNGATLDLNFVGSPDVIHSLFFDGVSQAAGTWGAIGSGADFTSPLITGQGWLQVTTFVPPPLWGDYNADGTVDAGDYVVWRDHLGDGDSLPNDDTTGVGPDDYDRWRLHFGESNLNGSGSVGRSSSSSSAAPEPSSALLLVVAGGAAASVCRWSRRSQIAVPCHRQSKRSRRRFSTARAQ